MSKKYVMQPKDEKCHELYVKWALEHLNAAVDAINRLNQYSDTNVRDFVKAQR